MSLKTKQGFSLLELLAALAIAGLALRLALPALLLINQTQGRVSSGHELRVLATRLKNHLRANSEFLSFVKPAWVDQENKLVILKLSAGNILKRESGELCQVIISGESPRAWAKFGGQGFEVLTGSFDRRRTCGELTNEEAVHSESVALIQTTNEALVGVSDFYTLGLEQEEIWLRSLIKTENLVIARGVTRFEPRISELGVLEVALGIRGLETSVFQHLGKHQPEQVLEVLF